jgi:hypothetical protein
LVSDEPVEYVITIRLPRAAVSVRRTDHGTATIEVENRGAQLRDPVVLTSSAIHTTAESQFLTNGLPNVFPVNIPEGSSTLAVHARATSPGTTLELYLYDCSSGECFAHNYTIPAAVTQTLVVRKPGPGRWIAAVNAAPSVPVEGAFVLETTVAGPPRRSSMSDGVILPPGAQAILCEVIDGRAERDELEHPWEIRENFPKLPHSPVAAGSILAPVQR